MLAQNYGIGWRQVMLWCAAGVLAGEVAIQVGVAPHVLSVDQSHVMGVIGLGLLAAVMWVVSANIRRARLHRAGAPRPRATTRAGGRDRLVDPVAQPRCVHRSTRAFLCGERTGDSRVRGSRQLQGHQRFLRPPHGRRGIGRGRGTTPTSRTCRRPDRTLRRRRVRHPGEVVARRSRRGAPRRTHLVGPGGALAHDRAQRHVGERRRRRRSGRVPRPGRPPPRSRHGDVRKQARDELDGLHVLDDFARPRSPPLGHGRDARRVRGHARGARGRRGRRLRDRRGERDHASQLRRSLRRGGRGVHVATQPLRRQHPSRRPVSQGARDRRPPQREDPRHARERSSRLERCEPRHGRPGRHRAVRHRYHRSGRGSPGARAGTRTVRALDHPVERPRVRCRHRRRGRLRAAVGHDFPRVHPRGARAAVVQGRTDRPRRRECLVPGGHFAAIGIRSATSHPAFRRVRRPRARV